MKILAVIPARYASTRFPGKPLADILGTSMVMRVYQQVKKVAGVSEVVVATDDERIYNHVKEHNGHVVMTSAAHPSGTDRCFEAYSQMSKDYEVVINVQGDEPFIDPAQIEELISCFNDPEAQIATLKRKIDQPSFITDPNKVKVVTGHHQFALYFSRQAIPFQKDHPVSQWLKHQDYFLHVGLYGYRADILEQITSLPVSSLEKAESLEQLRWLQNGFKIKVAETRHSSHGVDVPEDLKSLLKSFGK